MSTHDTPRYRTYFSLLQPELAARAVPLREGMTAEEQAVALEESEAAVWQLPPTHANEIRQRFQIELEMTDVRRECGQKMCAVNRGRLTRTYQQWSQQRPPKRPHLLPGAPLRAMNLSTAVARSHPRDPTAVQDIRWRSSSMTWPRRMSSTTLS